MIDNMISANSFKMPQAALSSYKDLLSVDDLMKIFGVSKNTIYKCIQQGKFGTPIQIGRSYKIPKMYIIKKFFINYQ